MHYKVNSTMILPVASIVLGAVFAWIGISTYGFWDSVKGPMTGMYPTVIGLALVIVGLIDFVKSLKSEVPVFERRNWLIILAVFALVLCSYIIGILASMVIFLVLWLKIVAKRTWKSTLLVTLVMAAIIYGIFIWWLQVPFETGLLFDLI